jgi:hypothetical protein
VPNILAHLAFQVRFDPQPAQRVHAFRFDPREGRWWCVELREVRACAGQILRGRRGGPRLEGEGCQGPAWGDRRGGGGGEEGGYGCHLGCRELADAAGVVDLQASADAARRVAAYPIEVGQGMLGGNDELENENKRGEPTLTKLFSNSCTPRM